MTAKDARLRSQYLFRNQFYLFLVCFFPLLSVTSNRFERFAHISYFETPFLLLNSLPASGYFCHLVKSFANSLDPDQDRQNVGPDLDLNCRTL